MKEALQQSFDIFHIHWPELALRGRSPLVVVQNAYRFLSMLKLLSWKGTKNIWTIHNLTPHERRPASIENWFYRKLISQIDGYITLSKNGLADAQEKYPQLKDLPGYAIMHGHYRDVYRNDGAQNARALFGIPEKAISVLHFGQLRDYKNIPLLIRAFRNCCRTGEIRLLIAGRPIDQETETNILTAAEGDSRVIIHARHIRDEEVQLYFRASDLVVLPYREIQNSGAALLGLSFDKPVLVPNMGAMPELGEIVGPKWLRTYDSEFNSQVLLDAMEWAGSAPRSGCGPLEILQWKNIAHQTEMAFKDVLSGASRRLARPNASVKMPL